jgi:putative FmdB family regulatory protein
LIYDYLCEKCDKEAEVVKPMADSSRIENCPDCGNEMRRLYSAKVHFVGTKVKDAEYYPSFGEVVKNDYHRKELIKKHNVIEIGNEKPDRVKYYAERHRKEKLAKGYLDE